jgi:hypothetical protein
MVEGPIRGCPRNRHADDYLLTVVLFASRSSSPASPRSCARRPSGEVLLGLGWLIFLAAVIWAATLPVSFSF